MHSFLKHILSFFIATAFLISCGKKDAPAEQQTKQMSEAHEHTEQKAIVELTQDQYRMADIELGSVEMKNLSSVIKVNGMLDVPPQNLVALSPRIAAYIRSTPLLQGLRVHKGQTLAVLEHQDVATLHQEFLETRSRLEFAEAEFKRQEELHKENINAVKTFQQITADYKSLQSRFAALTQRLALIGVDGKKLRDNDVSARYSITSPIDGYVGEVNISIGQYVSPSDVLCRIINTAHLHAELTVFERDAPKLRVGQRVRLTLANETEERTAKVYLIGREITQERTVRVHSHLDNADGQLLPNTALKAFIELGEQSVPAVPETALVSADGKEYIFVFVVAEKEEKEEKDSKHFTFQMVEVKRGSSAGGFTEVLLPENFNRSSTKIVVKGAYSLLSQIQSSEGGEEHGH